ncbi:MAG TPA: Sua5/YciO/YrdC/YwlC family protein [Gammaproteobacteria bacterium]|jgi:L-threonylcarbamoyladenylate synthase
MSNWHTRLAVHVLHSGGVIAYPTEAVYGIGCDPFRRETVERILRLKHRSVGKGMILIASTMSQLAGLVRMNQALVQRISPTWPGPVTWIVPAGELAPPWITGGRPTLAVRVTAHPPAASLCHEFGGPLVSTSANVGGRRPARTALEVRLRVPREGLDYVLPGKTGTRVRPTEIRHGETGAVLREG